jgi:lipopolysaccharide/colanic/teichoic acid biosynthesis glycosyltransferase
LVPRIQANAAAGHILTGDSMGDRRRDNGDPRRQAKYAYLKDDGTAFIVAGSAMAGLAGYAYQILGGRTLGAEAFAPVSVLLTIHFLTFIVILLPIEQLVVRRLTIDRSRSGVPTNAAWLATATVVVATAFAWFGVDEYLNGDRRFIAFTALTVGAHVWFAAARGHLAGWRRFRAYGMSSAAASVLRLAIAIGITLWRPSASGLAIALIVGTFVVAIWRPFRPVPVDRPQLADDQRANVDERGLLWGLVLAAAASQALLLSGPLLVGFLGGEAADISIAFAAFTLARAPLVFGYNLLARVLPPFTEMAARGERDELRSWARGMAWAGAGLGIIGGLMGWLLGPWVVELAYGEGFEVERLDAAVISLGVVFAGAGLFVGQILVARGQPARLGMAWLAGLVGAVAAALLSIGTDPMTRVSLAFAIGALVALVALVAGAVGAAESPSEPSAAYAASKRTIDIAVSLFVLVLTSPILLVAGIAVRLDSPGPVFFKQTRVGRRGQEFGLLKIRTMRADADEAIFAEHLAALEASRHTSDPPVIKIIDDPRITRVGRLLRRWSVDEIPNFWNVLRGSMSLVGPRPLVPAEAELIGLDNPRFEVKPGITGLAQVEGRDSIGLSERTRWDEEYVHHRSLGLDLRILVRTARTVVMDRGD